MVIIKYYLIPKGVDLASLKNESDNKNIVKHMPAVRTELIYQFCYQYERHKRGETNKEERDLIFLLNNIKLKTSGTITSTKLAYRIIILINEIGF